MDRDENLAVNYGEGVAHARPWKEIDHCRKQVGAGNCMVECLGKTPKFEDMDEDTGLVLPGYIEVVRAS